MKARFISFSCTIELKLIKDYPGNYSSQIQKTNFLPEYKKTCTFNRYHGMCGGKLHQYALTTQITEKIL